MNSAAKTLAFPVDQIRASTDPDTREAHAQTARDFSRAATLGVLWSLGATELRAVPGAHQCGGLLLSARILPLTANGRGASARIMAIMVSLTPADEIDIEVRQVANGQHHAAARGLYIDQLQRALLALDYDGPEPFNPRYWTN